MNRLECRVPPLVVLLLVGLLMWGGALIDPSFTLPLRPGIGFGLGVGLIAVGVVIVLASGFLFRRARTTYHPMKPEAASALVQTGIYRITRNPMYLGGLFALLGWGVWLANIFSLIFVGVYVAWIDRFQIRPEERALSALFGAEYDSYRRRVRRWL